MSKVRGRLAPSPTGEMHVGNASSALLAWWSVRARAGSLVMRIEDLDLPRVRAGSEESILEDLAWLGLDWDEGPVRQSDRFPRYDRAFERLKSAGRVYPCFCSRRDVAAAASAPQEPGDELRYPGTCRSLDPGRAEDRVAGGDRHVWRFRVQAGAMPAVRDRICGDYGGAGSDPPGDFIVRRFDGSSSYHLAVTVDDMEMGINEVVRGNDLLPSAGRQILLFQALGGEPPVYGHAPLILGNDGERLSKRHRGVTLRELREAGWSPEQTVGAIAAMLGLRPDPAPVPAAGLVEGFRLEAVPPSRAGLVFQGVTS